MRSGIEIAERFTAEKLTVALDTKKNHLRVERRYITRRDNLSSVQQELSWTRHSRHLSGLARR